MTDESQAPRGEGLVGSVRRLVGGVLHVLQTRLEILSTEIGEERYNLTRLALVALVILFCLQFGMLLAVLFIALAVSSEYRLAAIGISAAVLLLGAVVGVLWMRWWLKRRPPMFAATMAELRKDRDRLRGEE